MDRKYVEKVAAKIVNDAMEYGYYDEMSKIADAEEAAKQPNWAQRRYQGAKKGITDAGRWVGTQGGRVGRGMAQVVTKPKATFKSFAKGGDPALRRGGYYGLSGIGAAGALGTGAYYALKRKSGNK